MIGSRKQLCHERVKRTTSRTVYLTLDPADCSESWLEADVDMTFKFDSASFSEGFSSNLVGFVFEFVRILLFIFRLNLAMDSSGDCFKCKRDFCIQPNNSSWFFRSRSRDDIRNFGEEVSSNETCLQVLGGFSSAPTLSCGFNVMKE